jgi:hypothetical protein
MSYVTEQDAQTRWCPFSRVATSTDDGMTPLAVPAHNRAQGVDGERVTGWGRPVASSCIASLCMAWRGIPADNGESKIEGIKRRREETGCTLYDAKTYVETHPDYLRRQPSESGYCGLAGRPE